MLHAKFQASGPRGFEEEDFSIFFMYFYGSILGPLARGHLGFWYLCLNKLGKEPSGKATYQISTSEIICSEEKKIFFSVFLWFEPRTPWHRAILDPGTLV